MRYRDNSEKGLVLAIVFIIIAIFGIRGCATSVAQSSSYTEVVEICGKDVVSTGEGRHEYRVYTSGETYVVKDYYGTGGARFNSAYTYGRIQVGKTYLVRSHGLRFAPFSVFRNIETVTDTTQRATGTCG